MNLLATLFLHLISSQPECIDITGKWSGSCDNGWPQYLDAEMKNCRSLKISFYNPENTPEEIVARQTKHYDIGVTDISQKVDHWHEGRARGKNCSYEKTLWSFDKDLSSLTQRYERRIGYTSNNKECREKKNEPFTDQSEGSLVFTRPYPSSGVLVMKSKMKILFRGKWEDGESVCTLKKLE